MTNNNNELTLQIRTIPNRILSGICCLKLEESFNQFLSRFEITLKFYLLGNRILRSCFDCSHNSGAAQTLFMMKRKSRTDYYSIKYL
ncbi:unnamed protein product [Rhizophagus irregularis]|nr:unnamed protein product [Rhizophagus irregularis]